MVTQYEGETSDNIGMPSSDDGTLPPVEDFLNKEFKNSNRRLSPIIEKELRELGFSEYDLKCLVPDEIKKMENKISQEYDEKQKHSEEIRKEFLSVLRRYFRSINESEEEFKLAFLEYKQKQAEINNLINSEDKKNTKLEKLRSDVSHVNSVAFHELYERRALSKLNEEQYARRFCKLAEGVLSEEEYNEIFHRIKEYCRTARNKDSDKFLEKVLYDVELSSEKPFCDVDLKECVNYLRAELYDVLAHVDRQGSEEFSSDFRKALEYIHQCPNIYGDFCFYINRLRLGCGDKIIAIKDQDKLIYDLYQITKIFRLFEFVSNDIILKPFEELCELAKKKNDKVILMTGLYMQGLCIRTYFNNSGLAKTAESLDVFRKKIDEINNELKELGSEFQVKY